MKINQSTIAMASERQAFTAQTTQVTVLERFRGEKEEPDSAANAATLDISKDSKELSNKEQQKKLQLSQGRLNWEHQISMLANTQAKAPAGDTEEDFKIKMLRRLMESLRAMQEGRRPDYSRLEKLEQKSKAFSLSMSQSHSFSAAWQGISSRAVIGNSGPWKEQVIMSSIFTEKEVTSFSTTGMVQTEDGRSISFNLNLEMSREFTQAYDIEYTRKTFCVDPLVINLEGNPASFSDQTFFFDLDGDGKEEELAQLSEGSGFLALDKNGDGIINDGNELFGTKSGDGFRDLSVYDEDKNGWIDENDGVFKHLKIWTRDADGKNRLVAVKEAGVGAIYLGKAATEFSLNKQETNEKQGIIRSTGIFLKESGGAGTVQHVDLVI